MWNFDAPFLANYKLEQKHLRVINETTLVVNRWSWDYRDSLNFQKYCLEMVRLNKQLKVFIICNHPHCFTLGRGLQRGKSNKLQELQAFDESIEKNLIFPVFRISRGGGITFHYPGQWIIYPIINLNNREFGLSSLVDFLFQTTSSIILNKFEVELEQKTSDLIGLWWKGRKMASLGISIEHFVTSHGMALNLNYDQLMFEELSKINPCGMPSDTYVCLDQILEENKFHLDLISSFNNEFLNILK